LCPCLEDISQAQNDAAISAIRAPLIKEVRVVNAPFWNTEIARVRQVEEVRAKL
jgi:hypothetical protein